MKTKGFLGILFTGIKIIAALALILAIMKFFNFGWDDLANIVRESITGAKTLLTQIKSSI